MGDDGEPSSVLVPVGLGALAPRVLSDRGAPRLWVKLGVHLLVCKVLILIPRRVDDRPRQSVPQGGGSGNNLEISQLFRTLLGE
jgi:hypothetical protein